MKKTGNILWGIIFIILGTILGINSLNIVKIDIFFEGWWTLLIIIPCTIGLIKDSDKTGNAVGVLIGIALLLVSQKIIDFDLIWKLTIPIILIVVGISLMFKDNKINREIAKIKNNSDNEEYWATFAGQNVSFKDEEFKGADLNAIFGGIKFDLRDAVIKNDIVINASAIFGGIEILVPENVTVKVKSLPIFGGTTSKSSNEKSKKTHTIYINSVSMFGGVGIK